MDKTGVNIYVLRLGEQDVFYVGATVRKWEDRMMEMLIYDNNVPEFVKRINKKVSVEETILGVTPLEEMTTTLRYMRAYGVDNVRGGCFSNIILTQKQLDMIAHFMAMLFYCEEFLIV